MPVDSRKVTLLVPGCFTDLYTEAGQETLAQGVSPGATASQPPSHAGADPVHQSVVQTDSQCYEQALMQALSIETVDPGSIPSAACRYREETGHGLPLHCVCADPVHLLADTVNARLVPADALDIDAAEADALIESVNALLADDGFVLGRGDENHWFLTGMDARYLDTWPSHAVATGKIANYLPRHEQAKQWRQLLTEMQMLFHTHPVNDSRQAVGKLPINSIWFWGGAPVPTLQMPPNVDVFADDAFAKGLLAHVSSNAVPLAQASKNIQTGVRPGSADNVIVLDLSVYNAWLSSDPEQLADAKQLLNRQWIEPLQNLLVGNVIDEFLIDGCEGHAISETPLPGDAVPASGLSQSGSWPGRLSRGVRSLFSRGGDQ